MSNKAIIVLVSIPQEKAEEFSKTILEMRLCACINVIAGVNSYFWWENDIDTAKESLLLIKTREELYSKLKAEIEKYHPYDIPEIIAVDIKNINDSYLKWLIKETDG